MEKKFLDQSDFDASENSGQPSEDSSPRGYHDRSNGSRTTQDDPLRVTQWNILKTVASANDHIGKLEFRFVVTIEQPTLEDGSLGNKKVVAKIDIGERYIRLTTRALTVLMGILDTHRSAINSAIEEVEEENRRNYRPRSEPERPRPNQDSPRSGNRDSFRPHQDTPRFGNRDNSRPPPRRTRRDP